jgi:chaperonin cofactor prefoldin
MASITVQTTKCVVKKKLKTKLEGILERLDTGEKREEIIMTRDLVVLSGEIS